MLEPYQVAEARSWGADCILVIMAMVDDGEARALMDAAARAWSMDALVEVHDEAELDRALALDARLIGINNRDLKTFVTDLGVTLRLAPQIPQDVHRGGRKRAVGARRPASGWPMPASPPC